VDIVRQLKGNEVWLVAFPGAPREDMPSLQAPTMAHGVETDLADEGYIAVADYAGGACFWPLWSPTPEARNETDSAGLTRMCDDAALPAASGGAVVFNSLALAGIHMGTSYHLGRTHAQGEEPEVCTNQLRQPYAPSSLLTWQLRVTGGHADVGAS
jgi:hypothetical protein